MASGKRDWLQCGFNVVSWIFQSLGPFFNSNQDTQTIWCVLGLQVPSLNYCSLLIIALQKKSRSACFSCTSQTKKNSSSCSDIGKFSPIASCLKASFPSHVVPYLQNFTQPRPLPVCIQAVCWPAFCLVHISTPNQWPTTNKLEQHAPQNSFAARWLQGPYDSWHDTRQDPNDRRKECQCDPSPQHVEFMKWRWRWSSNLNKNV